MYSKGKDKIQVDKSVLGKRLKIHYSKLFPLKAISKEEYGKVVGMLEGYDFNKPTLVIGGKDRFREVFLHMFLSIGKYVSHEIINAYRLLDIYFQTDSDSKYLSLGDINVDALCLYMGYGEFDNARQSDVILQVANYQEVERRRICIYYKGNQHSFKNKYSEVYQYFVLNGNVIDLGGSSNGKKNIVVDDEI